MREPMTPDLSVYFKSMLAGIVAMFVCAIVVVLVALVAILWMSRHTEADSAIGWDFVSFARTPLAWTIFLLAFAIGFYLQYRHTTAR